ncbi:OmpA/MotB family protein [Aestuariispira insulae]|uniref:Chemotaxis protein MotB n=1 Tax=Aestuariispira insulae TaxID=1461337 RepID=A0A3D9HUA5_9PROT|nr:flagellar motor protein MotB [Aestuariispira insulae]RED52466.1 chemotaxis protein MotB [Aestuariispira insulae]
MFEIEDEDEHSEKEKAPIWLISFGDVTALLLAFFVMLFSMSHVQSEKWDAIVSLVSLSLEPSPKTEPAPVSERNIATVSLLRALSPEYLSQILSENLSRDQTLAKAQVNLLDDRVVISLPSDSVFLPGNALIAAEAEQALFRLAGVFSQFGNQIIIVGHTDPLPVSNKSYQSNWELSLARALSVADYLKESGYPGELTVFGMANGQYRYLNPNLSEERRYELARRVDIVIYPDAGGQP